MVKMNIQMMSRKCQNRLSMVSCAGPWCGRSLAWQLCTMSSRHPEQPGRNVQSVGADKREEGRQEAAAAPAIAFCYQVVELGELP